MNVIILEGWISGRGSLLDLVTGRAEAKPRKQSSYITIFRYNDLQILVSQRPIRNFVPQIIHSGFPFDGLS